MRDLANNVTSINLLGDNEFTSAGQSTTLTGTGVDTKGEARKLYALLSGLWKTQQAGLNTVTVVIQEDDSSVFASPTTLGTFGAQDGTIALTLDLVPTKRYVRARAVLTAQTGNSVAFNVWGIFYNERYRPSNVAVIS